MYSEWTMIVRLVLPGVAVVAIVAGCGSTGGSASETRSGSSSPGLSSLRKSTYVRRGNAACRKAREGRTDRRAIEAEIGALRALGPAPEGDATAIRGILTSLERSLERAEEAYKGGSAKRIEDYFLITDQWLAGFGLVKCII